MNQTVVYMSGAGNLFSVIDGRTSTFSLADWQIYSTKLCNGKIKTEGLIILKTLTLSDNNQTKLLHFETDFFNPDGSFGAMCGNGGRCAVRFALDLIQNTSETLNISFTMANTLYIAENLGKEVRVYFPMPSKLICNLTLANNSLTITGDYIDVGSQHFVINYNQFYNNIAFDTFDLAGFAPPFRYHPEFSPLGANINIYTIKDNITYLRTFERGVEAETGACGTGAISTVISLITNKLINSPVTIIPTSGIQLTVGFEPENQVVWLQGSAEFTGKSIISI